MCLLLPFKRPTETIGFLGESGDVQKYNNIFKTISFLIHSYIELNTLKLSVCLLLPFRRPTEIDLLLGKW